MSIFVENLKKLIKERGITQKKFLTDLGLNINAIGDWQKNGNVPKGDTLQRIANYFSVSVDYLLGKSDVAIDDSVRRASKRYRITHQLLHNVYYSDFAIYSIWSGYKYYMMLLTDML